MRFTIRLKDYTFLKHHATYQNYFINLQRLVQ